MNKQNNTTEFPNSFLGGMSLDPSVTSARVLFRAHLPPTLPELMNSSGSALSYEQQYWEQSFNVLDVPFFFRERLEMINQSELLNPDPLMPKLYMAREQVTQFSTAEQ